MSNPADACLSTLYMNDVCDDACNNRVCGYDRGRCTNTDILSKCVALEAAEGIIYASKPIAAGLYEVSSNSHQVVHLPMLEASRLSTAELTGADSPHLVPAAIALSLSPVRLTLNREYNEMVLFAEVEYTLQWHDPRLFEAPCFGALEQAISLTFEQGLSPLAREDVRQFRTRYWMPAMRSAGENEPGYRELFEESLLKLAEHAPHLEGYESSDSVCKRCASYQAETEFRLLQPHFQFFYFPFDVQEIKLALEVPGVYLHGCNGTGATSPALASLGLTEENKADLLLPPTKEWVFFQPLEDAIFLRHLTDKDTGALMPSTCEMSIRVRRNPTVFMFRSVGTTIIIVFGSIITAMLMHPEEFTGDREAVLFIAFLISVTNLQTADIGLGSINSLLWIDIFNLVQLILSIVSILQTVFVHFLFVKNYQEVGTHIDQVCHITLPFLYLTVTSGIFLIGLSENNSSLETVGISLSIIGAVTVPPLTALLTWLRSTRFRRQRKRHVKLLHKVGINQTPESRDAISKVFRSFDVDASGCLDTEELRDLLCFVKKGTLPEDQRATIQFMRRYANSSKGTLTENDFADALLELQALKTEGKVPGTPRSKSVWPVYSRWPTSERSGPQSHGLKTDGCSAGMSVSTTSANTAVVEEGSIQDDDKEPIYASNVKLTRNMAVVEDGSI